MNPTKDQVGNALLLALAWAGGYVTSEQVTGYLGFSVDMAKDPVEYFVANVWSSADKEAFGDQADEFALLLLSGVISEVVKRSAG